nr:MBL fold metallo-hydrolase [uncultured Clostridium sp.]
MDICVNKLNTRKFGFSNWCYIVEDRSTKTAVIVDPSWNLEMFTAFFKTNQSRPKAILVTHSHFDHTNIIDELVRIYDLDVYMSGKEIEYYKFYSKNLIPLRNNQVLKIDGLKIKCYLTPGHTKGSMCFLIGINFFTGDTIFYEGCGICSEAGGSPEDMFSSIQLIKEEISPWVRVFPGHVYGKEAGQFFKEIIENNIYFNILDLDKFIDFRMRPNQKNLFKFL